MNPQIQNITIMVSAIVAGTQIPFKNPSVLAAARTIYISINLAVLAILAYTRLRIAQVKDKTLISNSSPPTTTQAHDTHHIHLLLKSHLISMAIVALMHLYFKLPTPLLIQSILPAKNALQSNVVKVYVFGRPAVGELGRPWESGRGMGEIVRGLSGGKKGEEVKKSQ